MFRNNGLLHRNVIIAAGLPKSNAGKQLSRPAAHQRVLRFFSWLSSCALAQHSVTRTKDFSTRARPAPAPQQLQPAPAPQMRVHATRAG